METPGNDQCVNAKTSKTSVNIKTIEGMQLDDSSPKQGEGESVNALQGPSPSSAHTPVISNIVSSDSAETSMTSLNLEGLTKEEKKQRLRASIAQMEEEEEDEELRQLLAKHEELQKRKNSAGHSGVDQEGKKSDKRNEEVFQVQVGPKVVNKREQGGRNRKVEKATKRKDSDGIPKFDVENFVKGNLPSLADIQKILNFTDDSQKKEVKTRKKSRARAKSPEPSSESEDESNSESEEESEEEFPAKKRVKGGKKTSGFYARSGNSRIVSNELYAHAALEEEGGPDKDLLSLSFNLFVAGELEIITDKRIPKIERDTRLEILKMLAYKHEYLSREEVLNQYASFIRKIEKGKFRWGSEAHLQRFEQQLVLSISIEPRRRERAWGGKGNEKKIEERKKYCLDFNRGKCAFKDSHDGWLNNKNVWKLHVCRKCLKDHRGRGHTRSLIVEKVSDS